MNPQFKIFGSERRKLKKELSELKSFVKNFWHFHQMEKDMSSIYGSTNGFPMSDEKAKELYDIKIVEIEQLENLLNEPYEN